MERWRAEARAEEEEEEPAPAVPGWSGAIAAMAEQIHPPTRVLSGAGPSSSRGGPSGVAGPSGWGKRPGEQQHNQANKTPRRDEEPPRRSVPTAGTPLTRRSEEVTARMKTVRVAIQLNLIREGGGGEVPPAVLRTLAATNLNNELKIDAGRLIRETSLLKLLHGHGLLITGLW